MLKYKDSKPNVDWNELLKVMQAPSRTNSKCQIVATSYESLNANHYENRDAPINVYRNQRDKRTDDAVCVTKLRKIFASRCAETSLATRVNELEFKVKRLEKIYCRKVKKQLDELVGNKLEPHPRSSVVSERKKSIDSQRRHSHEFYPPTSDENIESSDPHHRGSQDTHHRGSQDTHHRGSHDTHHRGSHDTHHRGSEGSHPWNRAMSREGSTSSESALDHDRRRSSGILHTGHERRKSSAAESRRPSATESRKLSAAAESRKSLGAVSRRSSAAAESRKSLGSESRRPSAGAESRKSLGAVSRRSSAAAESRKSLGAESRRSSAAAESRKSLGGESRRSSGRRLSAAGRRRSSAAESRRPSAAESKRSSGSNSVNRVVFKRDSSRYSELEGEGEVETERAREVEGGGAAEGEVEEEEGISDDSSALEKKENYYFFTSSPNFFDRDQIPVRDMTCSCSLPVKNTFLRNEFGFGEIQKKSQWLKNMSLLERSTPDLIQLYKYLYDEEAKKVRSLNDPLDNEKLDKSSCKLSREENSLDNQVAEKPCGTSNKSFVEYTSILKQTKDINPVAANIATFNNASKTFNQHSIDPLTQQLEDSFSTQTEENEITSNKHSSDKSVETADAVERINRSVSTCKLPIDIKLCLSSEYPKKDSNNEEKNYATLDVGRYNKLRSNSHLGVFRAVCFDTPSTCSSSQVSVHFTSVTQRNCFSDKSGNP